MQVRQADLESDLSSILQLLENFFEDTRQADFTTMDYEAVTELLKHLVRTREAAVFVAETEDGRIVGTTGGILYPLWFAPEHTTGQEMFWYVDPEHRKSKAGKLLLNALEKWAEEHEADSFCVVALSHMHERRVGNMYESRGYVSQEKVFVKQLV